MIFILITVLFACNVDESSDNENADVITDHIRIVNNGETQKEQELNKSIINLETANLNDDLNDYIKSVINEQEKFFDDDTTYTFSETMIFFVPKTNWKIYYLKGEYFPSETEFCIYGAYLDDESKCFSYSHSVTGIYDELKFCEASKEHIIIYGNSPEENQDLDNVKTEVVAAYHPNVIIQN